MSRIAELREAVAEAKARGRPIPEGWAYWPFCEAEDKVPKLFILYDGPSPRGGYGWREHAMELGYAEPEVLKAARRLPASYFTQDVLRVPKVLPTDMPSDPDNPMLPLLIREWPIRRREFYLYPIRTTKNLALEDRGAMALRSRWDPSLFGMPDASERINARRRSKGEKPYTDEKIRRLYLERLRDATGLGPYLDHVRQSAKRRDDFRERNLNIQCFDTDGWRLHEHRSLDAARCCKQGDRWVVRDQSTYMSEKRFYKATGGLRQKPPDTPTGGVVEEPDLSAWTERHREKLTPERREHTKGAVERLNDLGLDHEAATRFLRRLRKAEREERQDPRLKARLCARQRAIKDLAQATGKGVREAALALRMPGHTRPRPITRSDGVRPPIDRTMSQREVIQAAREWHLGWRVWRLKNAEEIIPAGLYDRVMYWATKPLKRAHTSQGTHSHGTGTLSIMLRADGSRVYALPEDTVAPGWGDTPVAIVRERQKMNGGRKRRETVADFSDPTAEEAIGTLGEMIDELEDAAIPEEVPEWNPEEPAPESTDEMIEYLESDPEVDEDFSPSLLDPFRSELGAITAEVLSPRQREAFYLAHIDGMPNADVAEFMGIKTDTARKLVLDARKRIEVATGKRLPNRNRGLGMAA